MIVRREDPIVVVDLDGTGEALQSEAASSLILFVWNPEQMTIDRAVSLDELRRPGWTAFFGTTPQLRAVQAAILWGMARSSFETALEVVSLLAVVGAITTVALSWGVLPDHVPSHFGAAGVPDAYGSKNHVLIPVGLSASIYLLFSVVQRIPPRFYNFPVRITAGNADAQYRLARAVLASIKAVLSVLLAGATWLTVQVALGHLTGLGSWFLPAVIIAVLVPLTFYMRAAYRLRDA